MLKEVCSGTNKKEAWVSSPFFKFIKYGTLKIVIDTKIKSRRRRLISRSFLGKEILYASHLFY